MLTTSTDGVCDGDPSLAVAPFLVCQDERRVEQHAEDVFATLKLSVAAIESPGTAKLLHAW